MNYNKELKEIRKEIRINREIITRSVAFMIFLFSGLISEYYYLMLLGGVAFISEKNKRKGFSDYLTNFCGPSGVGGGVGLAFFGPLGLVVGAVLGGVAGDAWTFWTDNKNKNEFERLFKECYEKESIEKILKNLKYQKDRDDIWVQNEKKILLEKKEIAALSKEAKDDVKRAKLEAIAKRRQEEFHQSVIDELIEKYISGGEKKRIEEKIEKALTA